MASSTLSTAKVQSLTLFHSYSHADGKTIQPAFERLDALETASPDRLAQWSDRQILPGNLWRKMINSGLANCQVGILWISPNFLASSFIGDIELPELMNPYTGQNNGHVIPALLTETPRILLSDRGLDHLQLYRHKKKSFQQMNGNAEKSAFITGLYQHLRSLNT